MTDCSQDIIQPDIKYGTRYRGAYRSSKDAFLKKSESHNTGTMSFIGIGVEIIDDITPEIPAIFSVIAFDPGKVIKEFVIIFEPNLDDFFIQ